MLEYDGCFIYIMVLEKAPRCEFSKLQLVCMRPFTKTIFIHSLRTLLPFHIFVSHI